MDNVGKTLGIKNPPKQREVEVARKWYKKFVGRFSVDITDKDVVELYREVHTEDA